LFWHIDFLLKKAKLINVIVFLTKQRVECKLSKQIKALSSSEVTGFGCADCKCRSHLYFFKKNPTRALQRIAQ
jgi:sugar fermentation stimulation protein A